MNKYRLKSQIVNAEIICLKNAINKFFVLIGDDKYKYNRIKTKRN